MKPPAIPPVPPPAWYRYFGNNQIHRGWQVPDPPSWRPRRASVRQAQQADALRAALAPGTLAKGERYQASLEIRETVNAAIHLRRPRGLSVPAHIQQIYVVAVARNVFHP